MQKYLCLALLSLISFSCSGQTENDDFRIKRFDTILYDYLNEKQTDDALAPCADFLDTFGEQVIYIGRKDSLGYYERLRSYFSEPTLMGLYRDEQEKFADVSVLEKELGYAFGVIKNAFLGLKIPQVYMHVSGLNQSVVVTDDILSLSADKYLGSDYPIYQGYFYNYQLQQMRPERMAPDYLLGFLMANLPFKGNEDVLLDQMLYEGKLRYLLSRLLPERQVWEFVGYNREQYLWCSDNQSRIWKTILENQHLYKADYMIAAQYLKEAASTAYLPKESPGRVGIWVGYQIVISYMKQHPNTSLQQLMELSDAQSFLKEAKYKP